MILYKGHTHRNVGSIQHKHVLQTVNATQLSNIELVGNGHLGDWQTRWFDFAHVPVSILKGVSRTVVTIDIEGKRGSDRLLNKFSTRETLSANQILKTVFHLFE